MGRGLLRPSPPPSLPSLPFIPPPPAALSLSYPFPNPPPTFHSSPQTPHCPPSSSYRESSGGGARSNHTWLESDVRGHALYSSDDPNCEAEHPVSGLTSRLIATKRGSSRPLPPTGEACGTQSCSRRPSSPPVVVGHPAPSELPGLARRRPSCTRSLRPCR